MKGPDDPPKMLLFEAFNGEWIPVTNPPLIAGMSDSELEKILDTPLTCDIHCHSQSVEHTVALVSHTTKHRRTEDNQLMSVLQVASARKDLSGRVTHKRFIDSPKSAHESARKVQRFEDTPFNKVLY